MTFWNDLCRLFNAAKVKVDRARASKDRTTVLAKVTGGLLRSYARLDAHYKHCSALFCILQFELLADLRQLLP